MNRSGGAPNYDDHKRQIQGMSGGGAERRRIGSPRLEVGGACRRTNEAPRSAAGIRDWSPSCCARILRRYAARWFGPRSFPQLKLWATDPSPLTRRSDPRRSVWTGSSQEASLAPFRSAGLTARIMVHSKRSEESAKGYVTASKVADAASRPGTSALEVSRLTICRLLATLGMTAPAARGVPNFRPLVSTPSALPC